MHSSRLFVVTVVLVISSGVVCQSSLGQDKCTLAGTVVDKETGIHLPGTLLLMEQDNTVILADSEGNFSVQLAPEERAPLLVQRPGYHPLELLITVPAGQRLFLPIELEPRGQVLIDLSLPADTDKTLPEKSAIISETPTRCNPGHGVLAGSILDEASGEPVRDARIFVRGTAISATSDSAGHFAISLPSDTLYTIAVSHEGYEKDWYDLVLGDQTLVVGRFQLWQGQLLESATAMAKEIEGSDPGTLFADEADIESLASLKFKDMLYSLFPELLYAVTHPTPYSQPAYFLYVDGIRWNSMFLNHIDPYAIRAIAVWDGESAPSRFGSSIAVYVVGVSTYQ